MIHIWFQVCSGQCVPEFFAAYLHILIGVLSDLFTLSFSFIPSFWFECSHSANVYSFNSLHNLNRDILQTETVCGNKNPRKVNKKLIFPFTLLPSLAWKYRWNVLRQILVTSHTFQLCQCRYPFITRPAININNFECVYIIIHRENIHEKETRLNTIRVRGPWEGIKINISESAFWWLRLWAARAFKYWLDKLLFLPNAKCL